jgi:hypothetical protein
MKKVLLAGIMGFVGLVAGAQKWNPFVRQGLVSPAPLLPVEYDGTGLLSCTMGNSGESPMKLVANQEMILTITLSSGVPADADPLTSLGGTWAGKFTWNYDSSVRTYTATQNADIPGNSEGTVTIRYRVVSNSRQTNPSNGFNVNLQQPPYTNGINLTGDDAISAYTFVRALDYGDAPSSYGSAAHEINMFKDPGTGTYENYVYLGSSVDPELADLHSDKADGDDLIFTDDEDGVTFPPLIRGDTVAIPVMVTVHDNGFGVLNAWLDWNGDGDFTDMGEKIAGPLTVFETGTVTLTVVIPPNAEIARPVFARFRFGDNINSPGNSQGKWGEVEDYQVIILESRCLSVNIEMTSNTGGNLPERITPGKLLSFKVTLKNTGKTILNQVTIKAEKINPGSAIFPVLAPDETCVLTGDYLFTPDDRNAGKITITATGDSEETEPVTRTEIFWEMQ